MEDRLRRRVLKVEADPIIPSFPLVDGQVERRAYAAPSSVGIFLLRFFWPLDDIDEEKYA